MRFDQAVGGLHHAAEITGEGTGVHAIADCAGLVLFGHLQLCADRRLHALPHAGHGFTQLGQFIAAAEAELLVQLPLGQTLGQVHRSGQRPGQAAADHHRGTDAHQQRDAAQHQQLQQAALTQADRLGGCITAFLLFEVHAIGQRLVPAVGRFLHRAQGQRHGTRVVALLHQFAGLLVEWTRNGTLGRDGFGDGLAVGVAGQRLIGGPAGLVALDQIGDTLLVVAAVIALADQHLAAHNHHLIVGIEHLRQQAHLGHADVDHLLHRALLHDTGGGASGHYGGDQQQQQAKAQPKTPGNPDVPQVVHRYIQNGGMRPYRPRRRHS